MLQLEVAAKIVGSCKGLGVRAANAAWESVVLASCLVLLAFTVTLVVSQLHPCVITIRVFTRLAAIVPAQVTSKVVRTDLCR